jgi:hypothetical protein
MHAQELHINQDDSCSDSGWMSGIACGISIAAFLPASLDADAGVRS